MNIDVVKLTPEMYGNRSRDYQAIARVLNGPLNYSKMGADCMYNNISEDVDDSLLDLLAKTLGFEARHYYSASTLRGICCAFKKICLHKGTKESIEETVKVLLRSQNLNIDYYVEVDNEKREVQIYLSYPDTDTINLTMIDDVLEYILPVGYTYVINTSGVAKREVADTIVEHDKVKSIKLADEEIGIQNYSNNIEEILPAIGQDVVNNTFTREKRG